MMLGLFHHVGHTVCYHSRTSICSLRTTFLDSYGVDVNITFTSCCFSFWLRKDDEIVFIFHDCPWFIIQWHIDLKIYYSALVSLKMYEFDLLLQIYSISFIHSIPTHYFNSISGRNLKPTLHPVHIFVVCVCDIIKIKYFIKKSCLVMFNCLSI